MVGTILFLGLGVLDAIAEVGLILKLYRLPLWKYRYGIFLFAAGISIFSFIMRMILDIPLFDLPLQYLLFILFFRFAMNIKIHLASFIVGVGIPLYTLIQLGVYYIGTYKGHWGSSILTLNNGLYVQIIQLTSDFLVISMAIVFKRFNLGFSFIKKPPHDFFMREDYLSNKNLIIIASSCISAISIITTLFFLYQQNVLQLTILSVIVLLISYYFSRRNDHDDSRAALDAYSKKNKGAGS